MGETTKSTGLCLRDILESKDIKYKLQHYHELQAQINQRIMEIRQEIENTREQMYEIAAYPRTALDKEGYGGSMYKDLSDVLEKYEKLVQNREKELVTEVSLLTEEYELINRLYLCLQTLSGQDYEIISKLYCEGMPYKAVEMESGLSHSTFETRRQRALDAIYMLCTSDMTNKQIILNSKRKEEQTPKSGVKKKAEEYEQLSFLDDIKYC